MLKFFLIYKLTEIKKLSLKRICQGKSKKRIYLTIIVINGIFSIIYTKEKREIKNVY